MTVSRNKSAEHNLTEYQVQTELLPLLPLPEIVCFPGALLPVHVSDSSDCSLVHDAQNSDGLLVIAHYCRGWTTGLLSHSAELESTLCLCRIISAIQQPAGDILLLVEGLSRAMLKEEVTSSKPYRRGYIQVAADIVPSNSTFNREERKQELWQLYQLLFSEKQMDDLMQQTANLLLPLGSLCDLLAALLPMPLAKSSALLAAQNVDIRSELLIQYLRELLIQRVSPTDSNIFPPAFSGN